MPAPPWTASDLGTLYANLREPLQRFLVRHVRDRDAADDLLHDIFLRVHARADTLRDAHRVEAWVYSIARNAIVDRKRRERATTALDLEAPAPDAAENRDTLHELAASVRTCVGFLPEPYREALRLTALEGLSQKALAERLGLSASGAKSRVQRARRMLADMYRACCDLEFDARGALVGYKRRDSCWIAAACAAPHECDPRGEPRA